MNHNIKVPWYVPALSPGIRQHAEKIERMKALTARSDLLYYDESLSSAYSYSKEKSTIFEIEKKVDALAEKANTAEFAVFAGNLLDACSLLISEDKDFKVGDLEEIVNYCNNVYPLINSKTIQNIIRDADKQQRKNDLYKYYRSADIDKLVGKHAASMLKQKINILEARESRTEATSNTLVKNTRIEKASRNKTNILKKVLLPTSNKSIALWLAGSGTETITSMCLGHPIASMLGTAAFGFANILLIIKIENTEKNSKNIPLQKETLTPLNFINATKLNLMHNLVAELKMLVEKIPDELNMVDKTYIDQCLLSGESLLSKRQKVQEAMEELKNTSTANTPSISADLKEAQKALTLLENEWDVLYERLHELYKALVNLLEQTKVTTARKKLHLQINQVFEAVGSAAVSSEILEHAKLAQEALIEAIDNLKENQLIGL